MLFTTDFLFGVFLPFLLSFLASFFSFMVFYTRLISKFLALKQGLDSTVLDVEKIMLDVEDLRVKQSTLENSLIRIDTKQEMMLKMLTDINSKI